MKPHRIKKTIEFTEEEWLPIYQAAKAAGLDPREYIKRAVTGPHASYHDTSVLLPSRTKV